MADIRYLSPDHPQLAHTVVERLRKDAEQISSEISAGYCTDWADYKHRCGMLQSKMDDIALCVEIERELNG